MRSGPQAGQLVDDDSVDKGKKGIILTLDPN